VFNVDEIVVFDEEAKQQNRYLAAKETDPTTTEGVFEGVGKHGKGCLQLARILQYLECPQYLRKHFFPIHQVQLRFRQFCFFLLFQQNTGEIAQMLWLVIDLLGGT
jgi:predicted SPOUT superfamily RNA methylase MTH1